MITYQNPVYTTYFADPFVWKHGGLFYAVGTGGAAKADAVHGEPSVFQLLKSTDLVNWNYCGRALVRPDASLGTDFWAPEVAYADGRFWMYYSVGFGDKSHKLRVAVSDLPEGPYVDQGVNLIDPNTCPFAIDASPFLAPEGCWYLYYATDFLDSNSVRPGTALAVDRLISMTRLAGEPAVVQRATRDWQRFAKDRPMYGSVYDWHTLEGPTAVYRDGRIWVLYSGGRWDSDTYGVDFCVSDNPLGPYQPGGPNDAARVLKTIPGRVLGPGHNSVVTHEGTDWIVYHAWDPAMTARTMRIDPLIWSDHGPSSADPTCDVVSTG